MKLYCEMKSLKGMKMLMNIGIIGGGSLGLLIGSYLGKHDQTTIYVRRQEQKTKLLSHGINRSQECIPVQAKTYDNMQQEDLLIVCLKQYDLATVIPYINQSNWQTPTIFLQNGMGHIKWLKQMKQPIIVGVVEHGAFRVNDYTVKHTGIGQIKLAPFQRVSQLMKPIQSTIQANHFPVIIDSDWERLLVDKLVINAAINPLTAIFKIKNGELLTNDHVYQLLKKLTYETANILNLNPVEQLKRVQTIAQQTALNDSSMLQDIQTNGRTEIEAISGYLLEQRSEMEKPYTTFVYYGVKALELRGC